MAPDAHDAQQEVFYWTIELVPRLARSSVEPFLLRSSAASDSGSLTLCHPLHPGSRGQSSSPSQFQWRLHRDVHGPGFRVFSRPSALARQLGLRASRRSAQGFGRLVLVCETCLSRFGFGWLSLPQQKRCASRPIRLPSPLRHLLSALLLCGRRRPIWVSDPCRSSRTPRGAVEAATRTSRRPARSRRLVLSVFSTRL
jgi:hypothetical protein